MADGRVLVAGGDDGSYGGTNTAEIYNPATGVWSWAGNMRNARTRHTAALLADGRVLVAGGWNGQVIPSVEIFYPASRAWSATGRLITERDEHASAVLPNGRVLVAGGLNQNRDVLGSAEVFTP